MNAQSHGRLGLKFEILFRFIFHFVRGANLKQSELLVWIATEGSSELSLQIPTHLFASLEWKELCLVPKSDKYFCQVKIN